MRRLILAMFVLLVLALCLPVNEVIDYFRCWTPGAVEARRDIQRGHLELRGYGLQRATSYAQLLHERLNVQYKSVAGCSVSNQLQRHSNEYNEVMTREIERRFGSGVLARLADEAREAVAATRPAA